MPTPRPVLAGTVLHALLLLTTACQSDRPRAAPPSSPPRPAVIAATEGERRLLRGGVAALLIKVDPITTGSRSLVLGSSDLPPGDAIGLHRHLGEDEIVLITRGTALVQLGRDTVTASPGAAVFIPQGTCIAVANPGPDTVTTFFVFSRPGAEQLLRALSSAADEPPKALSPAERAAAFRAHHAEAHPDDC